VGRTQRGECEPAKQKVVQRNVGSGTRSSNAFVDIVSVRPGLSENVR
jgi:hypothetical protein